MIALPFSRRQPGWMAVTFHAERIDTAHVIWEKGARPALRRFESYRRQGDDVEALRRLRGARRLGRYRCATLLAVGEYQVVQVEPPNVPADELKAALRWKVKDMLDMRLEAATVEPVVIPPSPSGGRLPQLFAVAAANEAIRACARPFEAARVPLEVVDIPEHAQRNIAALLEDENRGLVTLVFDENGGLLTLTYQGELCAFRRIDVRSGQIAEIEPERRDQIVERLALELQRSLDSFDRQFNFISISRALIAEVPGAPWLVPALAAGSYVPVETLDLGRAVDLSAVAELREEPRQSAALQCVGAALRPAGARA
jgi:MSHA biogenesis protein MshI